MSIKSWFNKVEEDVLNEAHSIALEAVGVLTQIESDLQQANQLFAQVRADAFDKIDYHQDRAAQAFEAQAANQKIIENLKALRS